MSKITNSHLRKCIQEALENRKKRNFTESIDFQVTFRDYNPIKDPRFNSTTVLSHKCRTKLNVCLIGTMKDIDASKNCALDTVSLDDLKKFNGEAKVIKKWARRYDVILVSESLSRNVTKLVGRYVSRIGKLPVPLLEGESPEEKLEELYSTIRFRVKKYPWLAQSIGTDNLDLEEIRQNLTKALNFLVSLLPKGW